MDIRDKYLHTDIIFTHVLKILTGFYLTFSRLISDFKCHQTSQDSVHIYEAYFEDLWKKM